MQAVSGMIKVNKKPNHRNIQRLGFLSRVAFISANECDYFSDGVSF